MRHHGILRILVTSMAIATAHAWANAPQAPPLTQAYANVKGTPVTSVPSVSQIESWIAEDNYHVLLQVAAYGTYRLTLPGGCHNLRWAQQLSISGSQNRAWAGFDYLTADGQQCSIGSIERL